MYRLSYVFFVTIEVYKIIRDKKYQVHNSPVDNLATIFKGVFLATRNTGKSSIGAALVLSLAHEMDNILDVEGR